MIVFTRDKPTKPTNSCKVQLRHFLMLVQQSKGQLVMGVMGPLVLTTKPHSDITGQRSSLLLIPIPLALLASHFFFCFTPLRHFLTQPVLSISPGCGVRQRKAAVQIPAIEHALKANIKMPATSRVALLFLFCGLGGRARRTR